MNTRDIEELTSKCLSTFLEELFVELFVEMATQHLYVLREEFTNQYVRILREELGCK